MKKITKRSTSSVVFQGTYDMEVRL